ncbi:MAG: type II toxin-antitoxin system Phd/YefM family antitoxin, partial [Microcystaceae cyanobacterium]
MFDLAVSYKSARENFASLLEQIENDNSIALIQRSGHQDMALLPAAELSSLLETLYLLRSPTNARRLFDALEESRQGDKNCVKFKTLAELYEELGIER